ncbi:hypothetical protein V8F06_003261, partial [Rhypophila decipiens]
RAAKIHEIDMRYTRSSHKTDLLVKDEEARRLKLRGVLLRDENSSVKDQLAQKDVEIKILVEQIDEVRGQLESVQQKCSRQEKMIQTQSREISNLKEEISALSSISQDSAKVLSEKLALTREVAVLRPEIEHLRSQLSHQKDVLAEKLALERQLNTLEVELANERRAAQNVAQKQERVSKEEEELQERVRDLETELAKEKQALQKALKSQAKNGLTDEELQQLREELAAAESNLAAEKRKVEKMTKAQNSTGKEAEGELEQLRSELANAEKALAAEKRAAQRKADKKDGASETEMEGLREQLAQLEEALAKEKKARAEQRIEAKQAVADAESTKETLDLLKADLREAKQELKKCRAELEKARERTVSIPAATTTTVPLKKAAAAKAPGKKKRRADEITAEVVGLSTPSTDDRPKRPLKKRGFEPSILGEKSTFSITPFLNKTVNLETSPKPVGDDATRKLPVFQFGAGSTAAEEEAAEPVEADTVPTEEAAPTEKPAEMTLPLKKPRGRPKAAALADAAPSKKNLKTKPRKVPSSGSTLDNVVEEEDEAAEPETSTASSVPKSDGQENNSMQSNTSSKTGVATISIASVGGEPEPKKKKRKLLGAAATKPAVFEEEEDEGERVAPLPTAAIAAKASKAAAPVAKRPPKAGMKPLGKVGVIKGFGVGGTMRGRILEPGIRQYIQSLSLSFRTATTQRRDVVKSSPSSRSRSLSQLSPSSLTATSPSSTAYLRPQLIAPKTEFTTTIITRNASSSSNSRWKQRQGNDYFAREARVQGLKSRAAFKLLEMDTKYKLFKKSSGQMVVDLGFAPGSWSQVALERTKPDGYVLGIDLIPAQPPKGMNTIQGNFLSPGVQGMVKGFLLEEEGRRRDEQAEDEMGQPTTTSTPEAGGEMQGVVADGTAGTPGKGEATVITEQPSYIDMERAAARESDIESGRINPATGMSEAANLLALKEKKGMRLVDVILSDMSAPWPQTSGFSVKSLSNPYNRMMNTSGNSFRDHVGSMDLCKAALSFASDTLKPGGHFVCKFYQGGEDKDFETKLKKMFGKVHREKPESSRSESKESFFVALRRKPNVTYEDLGFE